jgi:16S rRNA processing protein RimM
VNTIEQAELLKHTSVYLPLKSSRKDTPKTIPNNLNSIQFSNLIGYSVIDQVHGPIGTIEAILEFPSHNILQIRNSDKTEILIPAIEAFVLKMDHEKKSLEMNTPEGLISVYLK